MGRKTYDWLDIQRYHVAGHNRNACMARFGFSISTWYKAILEDRLDARPQRMLVDWAAVQQYYDMGFTYMECRARFRFSGGAWSKAVKRGLLSPRSKRFPLNRLLAESKSRCSIKRRLIEAGVLQNRCDECGITEWRGLPLSIQLHHCNGLGDDNRLENLRMLCPNCHSQTSTFGTRNRKQNGSSWRIGPWTDVRA